MKRGKSEKNHLRQHHVGIMRTVFVSLKFISGVEHGISFNPRIAIIDDQQFSLLCLIKKRDEEMKQKNIFNLILRKYSFVVLIQKKTFKGRPQFIIQL